MWRGYPSHGYMEYVLSREEIQRHRHFIPTAARRRAEQFTPAWDHSSPSRPTPSPSPIRLCIWGSTQMDGQKHIWLQQLEHLNRSKFSFTWVVVGVSSRDGNSTIEQYFLRNPHVRTVNSPIEVALSIDDLYQRPEDGSASAWEVWDHKPEELFRYCIGRLRAAGDDMTALSPPWVREFLGRVASHLREEQCGVVIYGECLSVNYVYWVMVLL